MRIWSLRQKLPTLYAQSVRELDASRLLFIDDESELPIISRLGYAADAADFIRISSTLGITLSDVWPIAFLLVSITPLRSVSAVFDGRGSMPSIVQLSQLTSSVIVAGLKSQKMIFSASHELSSAISRTLLRDITFLRSESLGSASLMIELQSRLIWERGVNLVAVAFLASGIVK